MIVHFFKFSILYGIVFLSNITLSTYSSHYLLNGPAQASTMVVAKRTDLYFKWRMDQSSLAFYYHNGKTQMILNLDETCAAQLSVELKKKGSEIQKNNKKLWQMVYGDVFEQTVHDDPTTKEPELIADPLVVTASSVNHLSLENVASLLRTRKCCFYTGAGISAAAVPSMQELEKALFPSSGTMNENLKDLVEKPGQALSLMKNFFKACLEGEPTKAHNALAYIVDYNHYNCGVLTENVDCLHELSGFVPLKRDDVNWLKDNVTIEDLKTIDVVITVGLSEDQSGFLAWYKEHNPKGIIVAFDLKQPNYLSEAGCLVKGDVQETLPALKNILFQKK